MNILVLNGSPRKHGNTAFMIDAFLDVAKQQGHHVDVISVCEKNINCCLACEYCHTKGNGACIQQDDMQEIYPLLKEAEMIVSRYISQLEKEKNKKEIDKKQVSKKYRRLKNYAYLSSFIIFLQALILFTK